MTTYTAKHKAYYENNKARILSLRAERERKWMETPKGKYSVQKRKAKTRGITWDMSFEDWWYIWQASGHWEERGDCAGKYCMSRVADVGAYHRENVYINEFGNNTMEWYQRVGVDSRGQFNRDS